MNHKLKEMTIKCIAYIKACEKEKMQITFNLRELNTHLIKPTTTYKTQ